eukprot:1179045-Prorocentrum_minimum.AAC.1
MFKILRSYAPCVAALGPAPKIFCPYWAIARHAGVLRGRRPLGFQSSVADLLLEADLPLAHYADSPSAGDEPHGGHVDGLLAVTRHAVPNEVVQLVHVDAVALVRNDVHQEPLRLRTG